MATPGWTKALGDADLTVRLAEGVELLFQEVPAGQFWMGSRGNESNEEPRHLVRITRPFYMSSFPITQHQWRAVPTTCDLNPSFFKVDLRPVESVS